MGRPVIYLDASVIVPLFLPEPRSLEAEGLMAQGKAVVSNLAAAEFSSAISLAVRSLRVPEPAGRAALSLFDTWMPAHTHFMEAMSDDFAAATGLIRQFDLALRTPDALHIAIARRLGAKLLTFDAKMAVAAKALCVETAP
jgi:uncharacterized protein